MLLVLLFFIVPFIHGGLFSQKDEFQLIKYIDGNWNLSFYQEFEGNTNQQLCIQGFLQRIPLSNWLSNITFVHNSAHSYIQKRLHILQNNDTAILSLENTCQIDPDIDNPLLSERQFLIKLDSSNQINLVSDSNNNFKFPHIWIFALHELENYIIQLTEISSEMFAIKIIPKQSPILDKQNQYEIKNNAQKLHFIELLDIFKHCNNSTNIQNHNKVEFNDQMRNISTFIVIGKRKDEIKQNYLPAFLPMLLLLIPQFLRKRDAQFRQINASNADEDNINTITGDQNSSSVNEVDQDLFLNNKKEDQEQNDSVGQYRKEQDKKNEDI